jgi:hypothetical protein
MPLITPEYWSVDGVSLQDHAKNITTFGGSRSSVPPFRGEDVQASYIPGRIHAPKYPDSRTITLAMWVKDTLPNGSRTPGYTPRQQFLANWNALKRLFWKDYGAQINLTRRWDEGAGVVTATARASFAGGLEPEMIGPTAARFTVDLLLADPFFYGVEQSVTFAASGTQVVNNPGDAMVSGYGMRVVFNGTLTNPKLQNNTPSTPIWVKQGAAIGGGDYFTIQLDPAILLSTRFSDGSNQTGGITHGGAHPWMVLYPGNNSLTLYQDAGSGNAVLYYRPVYL